MRVIRIEDAKTNARQRRRTQIPSQSFRLKQSKSDEFDPKQSTKCVSWNQIRLVRLIGVRQDPRLASRSWCAKRLRKEFIEKVHWKLWTLSVKSLDSLPCRAHTLNRVVNAVHYTTCKLKPTKVLSQLSGIQLMESADSIVRKTFFKGYASNSGDQILVCKFWSQNWSLLIESDTA